MKVKPKRDLYYATKSVLQEMTKWERFQSQFFPQDRRQVPHQIYEVFNVIIDSDGLTYSRIKEFKIRVEHDYKLHDLKCNPDDFEIIERGLYVR